MDFRGRIPVTGFPRLDFREWISADGFCDVCRETVNFELFSTFPFFASALILPRTDHFKLLVCISVRGSWSISFHFFPFQVTYCSSRWFAILGPFPAATIDFSHPFPTCLESVPPSNSFASLGPARRLVAALLRLAAARQSARRPGGRGRSEVLWFYRYGR